MIIKNLAQLKRAIEARTPFNVVEHFYHPQYTGQKRIPNYIQTNGFYSVVRDNQRHEINSYNRGRGVFCPYGKARENWEFNGETVTMLTTRYERQCNDVCCWLIPTTEKVMTIKFLDEGDEDV
jgi:hypothetical protein